MSEWALGTLKMLQIVLFIVFHTVNRNFIWWVQGLVLRPFGSSLSTKIFFLTSSKCYPGTFLLYKIFGNNNEIKYWYTLCHGLSRKPNIIWFPLQETYRISKSI
jgi:hypothetical protein